MARELEQIRELIEEFSDRCEEAEYTDTVEAWDLLTHITWIATMGINKEAANDANKVYRTK